MFVYVVTSGSYSDYGIDAIFSVKEDAEKYAELMDKNYKYVNHNVEEWAIDAGLPRLYYGVRFARDIDRTSNTLTNEAVLSELPPSYTMVRPKTSVYLRGTEYEGTGWGESYDQAKKSLWDAIAQAKAEQAGV